MKTWVIVLDVVFILVVFSIAGAYFIKNANVRSEYVQKYDACVENQIVVESYGNEADVCIERGGCFVPCASYCDVSKPYIKFFEMFKPREKVCLDVCTPRCYYPVEDFVEDEIERPVTVVDDICESNYVGCAIDQVVTCVYNDSTIYKAEYNCFNSKDKYYDVSGDLITDKCGGVVAIGEGVPKICPYLEINCDDVNLCE